MDKALHQILSGYPVRAGVSIITAVPDQFGEAYLSARSREGRLLSDEMVCSLPHFKDIRYQQEWRYRRFSAGKLLRHIARQPMGLALDLGCGNGWFTHLLHLRGHKKVLGLDINIPELDQAARLFGSEQCRFACGNIFEADLPQAIFRYITVNSAVQYFPDIQALIERLLFLLSPSGEIHLLDSPFYHQNEVADAKERTRQYYEKTGTPAMADYYHHHTLDQLKTFNWQLKYHPHSAWNNFCRKARLPASPFPWIRIQHP